MIPNRWYAVLDSTQVPRDKPVGVTRMGEKLVFWRDAQGKVVCLRDKCAHRGAALSGGKTCDGMLQCPFHGLRYDSTGSCRLIPANGKAMPVPERYEVGSYPTHEEHGFVFLWWGQPRAELPPVPWLADLDASFSYAGWRDPWNVHYSRGIENQLDVAHLPFVHHNTIGRGNRTLVDGPVVQWVDQDRFNIYVFNRLDDGTRPLRPEELSQPERGFRLEFVFPNLWQNHISDGVRIVAAFVPVDQEHMLLYLRFYQNVVRAPLLRQAFNWLAMPFNLLVAHQDRRVVQTQRPKPSALKSGEKLIQADRPIVEYRRRRQELQAESPGAPGDETQR